MREIKKAAQYDGLGKMGLSGGHPLLVSTFELGRWGKSSTKEFERRKGPPPKCPNLSPCTIVLVLLMSPIILFLPPFHTKLQTPKIRSTRVPLQDVVWSLYLSSIPSVSLAPSGSRGWLVIPYSSQRALRGLKNCRRGWGHPSRIYSLTWKGCPSQPPLYHPQPLLRKLFLSRSAIEFSCITNYLTLYSPSYPAHLIWWNASDRWGYFMVRIYTIP